MKRIALLAPLALLLAGCGNQTLHRVPKVTGERLDVAQDALERRGLDYHVEGGPVFIRSHWRVVAQTPGAGRRARSVTLYVEHHEDDDWSD